MLLTDYAPDPVFQFFVGWLQIGVLAIMLVVNIGMMAHSGIKPIIRRIKNSKKTKGSSTLVKHIKKKSMKKPEKVLKVQKTEFKQTKKPFKPKKLFSSSSLVKSLNSNGINSMDSLNTQVVVGQSNN